MTVAADGNGCTPKYKRVLLKVSGEALAGGKGSGIDKDTLQRIATEVRDAHRAGVQIALVVGGGNIYRGEQGKELDLDPSTGDYMGMLATVINALALQSVLEQVGAPARVMTAIQMRDIAEPFIWRRAIRHLEKGRLVLFAAGTGHPFFTTDTAATLRAAQIHAEVIMKATNVDGVFDRDPHKFPDATRFTEVHYADVLRQGLKVMDATAFALGMDNQIPIVVFNVNVAGNITRAILGEPVGTIVS